MGSENHLKFSLIIPCYNESANIEKLFDEIKILQEKINFEIIIINNGSTDNSSKVIDLNKHKLNNFNLITIKPNVGIGHAIKAGIKSSKTNLICYTHADLQIKIQSCLDAYLIYEKTNQNNVFIKSVRKSRSYIEILFSILMAFFNSLIFFHFFNDIHAQPNFFTKVNNEVIDKAPDNMGIDLYFYLYFKRKKYKIIRFNVNFYKRMYGKGSNDTLKQKIKYIPVSLKNSLDIFKNGI